MENSIWGSLFKNIFEKNTQLQPLIIKFLNDNSEDLINNGIQFVPNLIEIAGGEKAVGVSVKRYLHDFVAFSSIRAYIFVVLIAFVIFLAAITVLSVILAVWLSPLQ